MNKEIENKLNAIASNDATELLPKEADLLLSYIEQLENNRDKAIDYVENETIFFSSAKEWRKHLLNILKGDSDE